MSLYPKPFSLAPIESKPISLIRKRKRNENAPPRNVKPRLHGDTQQTQTSETNTGTTSSNPICLDMDSDSEEMSTSNDASTNSKQAKIDNVKNAISPPAKPPPPSSDCNTTNSRSFLQCDKMEINTVEKAADIPLIETLNKNRYHHNKLHINESKQDMDLNGSFPFAPQMTQHLKKHSKVRSKTVSKKKTKKGWNKLNDVSKLDKIHNINMKSRDKESIIQFDDTMEDEHSICSLSDTNFSAKRTVFVRKKSINLNDANTIRHLQQQLNKYKTRYKEMRACAKRLYTECIDGEKPRWHLIQFIDTEHKVTRDSELAQLRVQISSLYPKGTLIVSAIDKWKGRKDVEQSVHQFVKLNGEYRLKPYMFINRDIVDLNQVIQRFFIVDHPRIASLNGQYGVKALRFIPKGTCIGQYFGAEILQTAFGKVFDGTGEEVDHNIYAFDQRIDPQELMKLKQKQKEMAKKRKQYVLNEKKDTEIIKPKVFIIDPFIGEWKDNELLLRFVNDCRSDIVATVPTRNDNKYYNVEYVGMKVNGWPQTYLIARRDIKPDEELMTYYGTDFNNAITMKLEEEERRRIRKQRVDRDILRGIRL